MPEASKKDGNKTVKARNAARGNAFKARLRLETLGPLHPIPGPPASPPRPPLAIPEAESLTGLYSAMCATRASDEACSTTGAPLGSTWGQCIVAAHLRAAVVGDRSAINTIVTRLEGKGEATAFLNGVFSSEEQLVAFFDNVKKRPESLAMFNRLVETKFGRLGPPVVHINFVKSDGDGRPALSSAPTAQQKTRDAESVPRTSSGTEWEDTEAAEAARIGDLRPVGSKQWPLW